MISRVGKRGILRVFIIASMLFLLVNGFYSTGRESTAVFFNTHRQCRTTVSPPSSPTNTNITDSASFSACWEGAENTDYTGSDIYGFNTSAKVEGSKDFEKGSTGNSLIFEFLTYKSGTFKVFINDSLYLSSEFYERTVLIIDLDGLDVGVHVFKVVIQNSSGGLGAEVVESVHVYPEGSIGNYDPLDYASSVRNQPKTTTNEFDRFIEASLPVLLILVAIAAGLIFVLYYYLKRS